MKVKNHSYNQGVQRDTCCALRRASIPLRLLIPLLYAVSPCGLAYEQGDILVRAGYAKIEPDLNSDVAKLGDLELGKLGAESVNTGIVDISYFLSSHWALETMLSIPPNFDINGTSGLLEDVPIGRIQVIPLVVIAQYYPLAATSKWQPFLGAGFNYIIPDDIDVDSNLAPLFGADKVELEVENSFGLVLSLGLDYRLTDKLSLTAQAHYADVEAKGTATVLFNGQGIDIDLFGQTSRRPLLYTLTIGYMF